MRLAALTPDMLRKAITIYQDLAYGPAGRVRRTIELPAMTPGGGRRLAVHRFGRRGARPKAYLQAAIHANELPGTMALHNLMPMLVEAR